LRITQQEVHLMPTHPNGSESPTDPHSPVPVSPATWLRTPVALTVERWVLVAAGVGALLLLLVALD
jgi:hypothetical protein